MLLRYTDKLCFLFLVVCLLSISACKTSKSLKSSASAISTLSPTIPVLKKKTNNTFLRISIDGSKFPAESVLESITFQMPERALNLIDNLILYSGGQDSIFNPEQKLISFGIAETNSMLTTNEELLPGVNYFWLCINLLSDVNLSKNFEGKLATVEINGKQINLNDNQLKQNIGYALRKHGDDGVHTYRIPGIIKTNAETLIAVYDIRRNGSVDLQEDIDVGMSRSTDHGSSWEEMEVIMDMKTWGDKPESENGIGDPSILYDAQNNTIWVAGIWAHGHPGKRNWFASQPGIEPSLTSQLMLTKSMDDGLTWSEPINITSEIKDPKWHLLLQGPGRGIQMKNGTLVFPAQYKDENEMPHSTILYSKDFGENWILGVGAKSNTTEAQVVELSDGSLMLNMRDNRGSGEGKGTGARSVAITKDLGKTWTEHPTSRKALIEPVCNAGLIKHHYLGKDILVFVNPANQYQRSHMTLKVSFDEGMTWPEKYHYLIDEGKGRGYPSICTIDENTIGLLYEGSQADITFQKIDLREIIKDF